MSRGAIALGVTGGIAAYKSAELVRLLTTRGYDVTPIMTPWATRFIGPLTFESLTGKTVHMDTPTAEPGEGIAHISVVRAVDLLLIAPLTANTMAKMASGMADNFLTNAYLAHTGPTMACPAMNTAMLAHPATQRNLAQIRADGVHVVMGDSGSLACGEEGAGRMAEPEIIAEHVDALLGERIEALAGRKVLVTAGPTVEDLDPVRYLTNRSSGRMGVAVARAFRNAGSDVTLVHGPLQDPPPHTMVCVATRSAADMAEAVLSRVADMDVVVMAAAVADYRPPYHDQKLKKGTFDGALHLERTTDILAELGKNKPNVLAGFAAESETVLDNAKDKLARKNLDFIFANDISAAGQGFGGTRNRIIAVNRQGESTDLGEGSKDDLAAEIVQMVASAIH